MGRYAKMCEDVAKLVLAAGFVVYISENGEHGFFTDEAGSFVASFGGFGYVARFSGNYQSSRTEQGTGWMICEVYPLSEDRVRKIAVEACCPPSWATGGFPVKLHTVQTYMALYGSSSGFRLFNVG